MCRSLSTFSSPSLGTHCLAQHSRNTVLPWSLHTCPPPPPDPPPRPAQADHPPSTITAHRQPHLLKKIRSNLLWTTLESNQGRKLSHRFVSGPSWVTDEAQVLWRPALKDTCARGQGVGSNFHILLPQSSQAGPGGAALGDPHTQPEP